MTDTQACRSRKSRAGDAAGRRRPKPAPAPAATPTKLEQIVAMLSRPEGASLAELVAATGWQAHSVRGALAGSLKRKGYHHPVREGGRRAALPDRSRAMTARRRSRGRGRAAGDARPRGAARALAPARRQPAAPALAGAHAAAAGLAAAGRGCRAASIPRPGAGSACAGRVQAEGLELGVGARLRREWRGRTVEVVVEEDGFRWEERLYPSLSAAATAIAGTRWNGPRFFGLRRPGR